MPTLTLSLLTVIWTDNSVAFPFDEEGSTIFASCLLCGPEATFFYLARPMFQALLLKHASFCKLFAGLGSASESATSLLLSDFRFVLSTLFSPPPSFSHSLAHLAKTFFFHLPDYQATMGPRSLIFFLGMSWQGMVHCPWHSLSQPSTLPCSFSPFTCRIHSSFFPDWRRAVSTKFFDRFPQYPLRNLCFFVTLVVSFLIFAATNTALC